MPSLSARRGAIRNGWSRSSALATWKAVADEQAEIGHLVNEVRRVVAAGVQYSDIAIPHRFQSELRMIESELQKRDIPAGKGGSGAITMTLHQAKGLEFPLVVLPAVDEDMIPHFHALQDGPEALRRSGG